MTGARPTHRHKATGDIAFFDPATDNPDDFELLPDDHWDTPEMREARIRGEIVGIKEEAARRILKRYPDWKQRNAALFPDEPWVAEMRAFIRDVRAWSNDEESGLRAAHIGTDEENTDG